MEICSLQTLATPVVRRKSSHTKRGRGQTSWFLVSLEWRSWVEQIYFLSVHLTNMKLISTIVCGPLFGCCVTQTRKPWTPDAVYANASQHCERISERKSPWPGPKRTILLQLTTWEHCAPCVRVCAFDPFCRGLRRARGAWFEWTTRADFPTVNIAYYAKSVLVVNGEWVFGARIICSFSTHTCAHMHKRNCPHVVQREELLPFWISCCWIFV